MSLRAPTSLVGAKQSDVPRVLRLLSKRHLRIFMSLARLTWPRAPVSCLPHLSNLLEGHHWSSVYNHTIPEDSCEHL